MISLSNHLHLLPNVVTILVPKNSVFNFYKCHCSVSMWIINFIIIIISSDFSSQVRILICNESTQWKLCEFTTNNEYRISFKQWKKLGNKSQEEPCAVFRLLVPLPCPWRVAIKRPPGRLPTNSNLWTLFYSFTSMLRIIFTTWKNSLPLVSLLSFYLHWNYVPDFI